MWKRKLYEWHRKLAIIALIPVLMWTSSGIMHPIMSNFKPELATKFLRPSPIDASEIEVSLDSALQLNAITTIQNFRIVEFKKHNYYQIQLPEQFELVYLDVSNGKKLTNGDRLYAEYLARSFAGDQESPIADIGVQEEFTTEYARIFRFLPAYRVAFDRPDGLRLFVETKSSRLGTAVNNSRATFSWLFAQLHNWDFLNFNAVFRISFILVLVAITLFSALTGMVVYSVLWKSLKTGNIKAESVRKYHRTLGIIVSFALLLFGVSAAFHIFPKYTPDNRAAFGNHQVYKTTDLEFSLQEVLNKTSQFGKVVNASLITMNGENLLQVHVLSKRGTKIHYLNLKDNQWMKDGDQLYARYLANKFSGYSESQISSVNLITKFAGEYGFVNKRLPVYKVQYQETGNPRYYVETSTGLLGAKVNDKLAISGFMFGYFHKYRFMNFAGKVVRDTVMSLFALGNFITALMGLLLYLKRFNKKPNKRTVLDKREPVTI